MNLRASRSYGLLAVLAATAASAALVNCSAPNAAPDTTPPSEDAVTGINNALGLGLRYDASSGHVQATLGQELAAGERLFVRVRRGKITVTSQSELSCDDLTQAQPLGGDGTRELTGKTVYDGPAVDKSIIDLLGLYDDPNWATGNVSQDQLDQVHQGPDAIVEACIVNGGVVRAKLQTTLAFAWDTATADTKSIDMLSKGIHFLSGGTDGGVAANPVVPHLAETDDIQSQIAYGELCVQELGEIPFFPKISEGKYETFDCRDYVASNGTGAPVKVPGVEGAGIPIRANQVPITKCDPDTPLGPNQEDYNCVQKCDEGMFLSAGACQPGPSVVTATNAQGTHWVLLCRKVSDDGKGMMKSKMFNDIAMIGNNPKTGRTCFFQNSIGSGRDGAHVTHPADREKSTAIWSSDVQSYCSGSCHAADAFVHSKWIDGAKRTNGNPIIPMMGRDNDYPISNLEAPYNIVAADKLGFQIPQQLVSDDVGPCANCHRLAGNTAGNFAPWATGTGDEYFSKITDFGKTFAESHWMPQRLDQVTPADFATSKYGKALNLMATCNSNPSDPSCVWANSPRGAFNNPAIPAPTPAATPPSTTPAPTAGN